jgi:hypothetical protein
MPASVTYPNITESTKEALSEVLLNYFDGAEHHVSGLDIIFPEIALTFNQQYRRNLVKPTVAIIGTMNLKQTEHKYTNPLNSRLPGVMLYADVVRTMVAVVPTAGKQHGQANQEADQLWDCLYAAFVGKKVDLASRGICNVVPPVFPLERVDDTTLVERIGLLRFQVQVAYSRFNADAAVIHKRVRLWPGRLNQTLSLKVGCQSQPGQV